jgi:hypothetical protein
VRLTAAGFAALLAGEDARAAELEPALAAAREPRAELTLERAGAGARCWLGDDAACLLVSEDERIWRLFSLDLDELPVALGRAVGARDGGPPAGAPLELTPGDLASALAAVGGGDRPDGPLGDRLDGFRAHWRIGDDRAAVEVVDTEAGPWAVVPAAGTVELRPVDGGWIEEAIADLVGAGARA